MGMMPFNSTSSATVTPTASTSWVDMPGMITSIKLTRTSHVIIMLSSAAWLDTAGGYMFVQALVDSRTASPPNVTFTRADTTAAGSYSHIFYLPKVRAGIHTVKIQWKVRDSLNGWIGNRALTVMALPTSVSI